MRTEPITEASPSEIRPRKHAVLKMSYGHCELIALLRSINGSYFTFQPGKGQILCALMISAGIGLYLYLQRRDLGA